MLIKKDDIKKGTIQIHRTHSPCSNFKSTQSFRDDISNSIPALSFANDSFLQTLSKNELPLFLLLFDRCGERYESRGARLASRVLLYNLPLHHSC
mmetsp:Transcript_23799/g.66694  ORF Transcript_23799/g.66694 Transcript_23799/m.66694 type:complete len:95 (-) Transcript_23799:1058-1342(-)